MTPDVRKKQYAGALLGSPPAHPVDDYICAQHLRMPRRVADVVHTNREPRRWQKLWPERDRSPEPVGPVRPARRRIIRVLPL